MPRNKCVWLGLVLLASLAHADDPPPSQKKKLTLQDLLKASSPTSSHSATVAGVRGLDETSAGIDTKARNFGAIDRLDKNVVSPAELRKFMEEGKLK